MIVLDTNVVSELMRPHPHPAVAAWAKAIPQAVAVTTAVTEAELRYGAARLPAGARRRELEARLEQVFASGFLRRILPFDRPATHHYADILATRTAAGRPMPVADLMIAATALAHGATAIATRNTRDFEGCGLDLVDPWAG